jgi:hypothetical protein
MFSNGVARICRQPPLVSLRQSIRIQHSPLAGEREQSATNTGFTRQATERGPRNSGPLAHHQFQQARENGCVGKSEYNNSIWNGPPQDAQNQPRQERIHGVPRNEDVLIIPPAILSYASVGAK